MFTLIANIGQNRELGRDGDLCFHLKEDMKFFKQTTSGHPVIMGRKTWDSLPKKLPNRQNIVVSRHPNQVTPKQHPASPNQIIPEHSTSLGQPASKHPTRSDQIIPKNSTSPDQIITDFPTFLKDHASDPEEYFVIGGASIYAQALPYAKKLLLTEVAATSDADTFFPDVDLSTFTPKLLQKGTENGLAYTITSYIRKQ